jgi:hypothetical protein
LEFVSSRLASPRFRRRLSKIGIALAAVAAAVGIVVWDPGGIDPPKEAARDRSAPVLERPTAEPAAPVPMTREARREIDATVHRFVESAVARRNLDSAWELASPEMRASVERSDWDRGELPVLPYPAAAIRAVDWQLGYVDREAVIVDVMIQPKQGSGERVQVYSAQLSYDDAEGGRWLVDSWIPAATLGGEEPRQAVPQPQPGVVNPLAFDDARLSPWWFLVPAFFLALLVLTPLVLVLRGVRSRRRADRSYREWSGADA